MENNSQNNNQNKKNNKKRFHRYNKHKHKKPNNNADAVIENEIAPEATIEAIEESVENLARQAMEDKLLEVVKNAVSLKKESISMEDFGKLFEK